MYTQNIFETNLLYEIEKDVEMENMFVVCSTVSLWATSFDIVL